MSICCEKPVAPPAAVGSVVVALAGNPNSGKTTLFNALTGLRQKVANYPGVTVEKKTGRCKLPDGRPALVIDLPGAYSLISRSPDEVVAMQVLRGLRDDTPEPDVVVVVVDASNLQRNLYLVSQLVELGRPLVVALNMMDIAQRRGIHVDVDALRRELEVPVVPVVGHKRRGMEDLKKAILEARVARMPDWPLPQAMKEELVLVGGGLAILDSEESGHWSVVSGQWSVASTADSSKVELQTGPQSEIQNPESKIQDPPALPLHPSALRADMEMRRLERYQALAERLLIGDYAQDLSEISRREPVSSLLSSATARMSALGIDPMQADIEAHYRWIEKVANNSVATYDELAAMGATPPPSGVLPYASPRFLRTLTDRVDAIFVHRVWGLLIFAAIMGALFLSLFWIASPLMEAVDGGVKALGRQVTGRMPEGPLRDLVNDGIFGGVGSVVVFVPQIALLFVFLAILEDSGYLARAAFLMDRLLARVGLHGKSFIPLLSSFACAIPGIMATRTIESRSDRLATIMIAPLMSCSARLPVYGLLIATFFGHLTSLAQGAIMLALYAGGIAAAAGVAWIFRRTLLKGAPSSFILEMPSYKLPQASQVLRQTWTHTWAFLARAGTIIFCLSVILWAMTYYPRLPAERAAAIADEKALAAAQLEHSIAGRVGHVIEPAIRPLGYDWKIGVGLVGAFAAREVFVSTMGVIYSVGDVGDQTTDLAAAMRADVRADDRPVWTPLVAVSLLIWFVLAMQCASTLAVVKRETGTWRWPILMVVYLNALSYIVCLGVYQVGKLF